MKPAIGLPTSLSFLLVMTALLGIAYPLTVTGLAQALFPSQANGSLLVVNGAVRGSALLAQKFESARFFQARPSATDYAWVGSGASNLAATNPVLASLVEARRAAWSARFAGPPPADMLYSSASGLDPDISLEAALGQVDSVAQARKIAGPAKERLITLIAQSAERQAGILGPPRVNVVELNARLETDPDFATTR